MERMRASLVLVVLSAAPRVGAETIPADPAAIVAAVKARGPAPVLDVVAGDERVWPKVIAGVRSGAKPWLEVAVSLKPATKHDTALELTVALHHALLSAPQNVLGVLGGQAFDPDDVCSLNTIEDMLGKSYGAALRSVEGRQRAVARVRDPRLAAARDECLVFLRELKDDVRRYRTEWFDRP